MIEKVIGKVIIKKKNPKKRGRHKKDKMTRIHQEVWYAVREGLHNGITINAIGDKVLPIHSNMSSEVKAELVETGRDEKIKKIISDINASGEYPKPIFAGRVKFLVGKKPKEFWVRYKPNDNPEDFNRFFETSIHGIRANIISYNKGLKFLKSRIDATSGERRKLLVECYNMAVKNKKAVRKKWLS